MDGSPTTDVLTHHGYELNSKGQNKCTQSLLGPRTPWEEENTFSFMHYFMLFLESYFYVSKSKIHSQLQTYLQLTSLLDIQWKLTIVAFLCNLL